MGHLKRMKSTGEQKRNTVGKLLYGKDELEEVELLRIKRNERCRKGLKNGYEMWRRMN